MKKIFKKAVTVLGSFALLGATVGMAAAAAYPAPFTSNTAVVVGASAQPSDNIAAGNIASDLGATYASGSTDTSITEGEIVELGSGSTRIYLNTSLNTAKTIFTKSDLPTVLEDFTFSGNVDAKLTSTIKFGGGTAAGNDNSDKVIFSKQPKSSNDPIMGISLGSDEGNYLLNLTFTSPAINFNHPDSEGENIRLFGRDFVISTATDRTNLVLFASSEEVSLSSGGTNPNPVETVTVDGAPYEIELVSATDTSATISVNGDVKEVSEGASKKIGGIDIAVKIADEGTATNTISAVILVGANKLTFTDGSKVKQGSDDSLIDGTHVKITGNATADAVTALTELRVSYYRPTSNDDVIVPGEEWIDPVFEAVKVDFNGLSSNLDDTERETITIANSGDKGMSLVFTDSDGNDGSFIFAYSNVQQVFLGDDGNYSIHVREMENVSENQFVVLGNEDYGHLLEVTQINNDSGTDYTKDKVTFSDVFSGTSTTVSFTSEGTGTLSLDGKSYTVYMTGTGDSGRIQIKYPTGESANANTAIFWPTIKTKNGAKVALYYPITLDLGKFDNLNTPTITRQNQISTIRLPDGDGYTDLTLTYTDNYGLNGTAANWTIAGGTSSITIGNFNTTLDKASRYYVANTTVGDITYYFEDFNTSSILENMGATANLTRVGILRVGQSSSATAITSANTSMDNPAPGVLIWEEKDGSSGNEYKPIFVDIETLPSGGFSSTNGIGVNDVFFGSDTRWSATMASDSDIEKEVDWWGTLVTTDSSTSSQKTVTISYPDEQVYANIFVGEASASVGGDTGVMTYTDTQSSSFTGMNLVVVGGSCINNVAAELIGGAYCEGDFTTNTGVGAGSFLIESFDRNGKTATLVAGYHAEDTTKASQYLINNHAAVDTTVGTKYTGSSETEASLYVA